MYTPAKTRHAEDAWRLVMRAARRGAPPETGPVGLLVWFRLPDRRRSDLDNLLKLVLDSANPPRLNTWGLWLDDSQAVEQHAHIAHDCHPPGTDLLIWRR